MREVAHITLSGDLPRMPQHADRCGKPGVPNVRFDALAASAKRKQGPGLIASQSEIKDVKVVPHVSAVCRSGERQHPELESETIYYLGNRLVVAIGNFGHAWSQENLPISGN